MNTSSNCFVLHWVSKEEICLNESGMWAAPVLPFLSNSGFLINISDLQPSAEFTTEKFKPSYGVTGCKAATHSFFFFLFFFSVQQQFLQVNMLLWSFSVYYQHSCEMCDVQRHMFREVNLSRGKYQVELGSFIYLWLLISLRLSVKLIF